MEEHGKALRWARFLYWRYAKKRRFLRHCEPRLLQQYARQIEDRLRTTDVDAIFSPSSLPLAYLKAPVPTVFWTDACFAGMLNFYGSFSGIAGVSVKDGHSAEQQALIRCSRAVYSSDWAAETARRNYRVPENKLRVIPFGGNLIEKPSLESIKDIVAKRDTKLCNLLFVGVDWKRKGADVAVQTAEALVAKGVDARLTIVGCNPPPGTVLPSFVKIIPFIGKETVEGRRQLNDLYSQSHFFIMPSRAEAYGLVFAEANTFGLPCLATSVGGIPSIITNGINGQLFSAGATGSDYANYIYGVFNDTARYRALAVRSAEEAETRLSWKVSGSKLRDILNEVVSEHPTVTAVA